MLETLAASAAILAVVAFWCAVDALYRRARARHAPACPTSAHNGPQRPAEPEAES